MFNNLLTKKVEFESGHHGWVARYNKESDTFTCKTWRKETIQLSVSNTENAIKRYNTSRELIPKSELNQQAAIEFSDKNNNSIIKQCELNWMIKQKPLVFDKKQIVIDLGESEANLLFQQIETFENKYKDKYNKDIFGALAWNGVVSRWKEFMNFLNDIYSSNNNTDEEKKNDNNNSDGYILKSARDALYHFGNSLGRVISYRALALTASEFDSIKQLNEIVPTGQLRASLKEMQYIVDTHGVTKITVARLYISKLSQWIGLDPSLSLHDDCETALCISQTYMNEKNKKYVYLFEMDVPKVMSIGFKVVDVQNKAYLVDQTFADRKNRKKGKQSDRWFGHNGVWFDAYDERCERQLLYSIPFFKERCREITVFKTRKTLLKRIEPFKVKQQQLKDASEQEMKNENE
eukprot:479950_1